ncbi:MAG: hypothetical protein P8X90_18640 [Desulfobacterales bacterium]
MAYCKHFVNQQNFAKKQRKYQHAEKRLDDRPQPSKNRLLVTNLDVSFGQKIQKLAIFPDLLKIDWDPAFFRFNDGNGLGRISHLFLKLFLFSIICFDFFTSEKSAAYKQLRLVDYIPQMNVTF